MQPVRTINSKLVPLPMKDVDTDLIIPAQFLTSISREGFGKNLFYRLRQSDPNFPLDQPKYAGAEILVTDSNFGCGSSREHAVWALQGAGLRAVVAKSFADIFYNNAAKNGLLLVTLPAETVDRLLLESRSGDVEVTIDLEQQSVTMPSGEKHKFDFDEFRRHCMLNGLDDIDYIRSHKQQIDQHRQERATHTYVATTQRNCK